MLLKVDNKTELRTLEITDAIDIFTTIDSQREYLGEWLPFVASTTELSDTQEYVRSIINALNFPAERTFTIRVDGEFAGIIGFKDTDWPNKRTEIGYWMSEVFQRRGIMTRSVEKLCERAFVEMDLNRVQIKCAVGNARSKQIPIRLGFQLEGIERDGELLSSGSFTDIEIYSKLRSD